MKEQRLLYRMTLMLLTGVVLGAGRGGLQDLFCLLGGTLVLGMGLVFCRRQTPALVGFLVLGLVLANLSPQTAYLNQEVATFSGVVTDVNQGTWTDRVTVKAGADKFYIETKEEGYQPGMRLAMQARVTTKISNDHPGLFSYQQYLWSENITAIIYEEDILRKEILPGKHLGYMLLGEVTALSRAKMLSIPGLSEENRVLLCAMVLGDRSALPAEVEDLFGRTMVYHVLAVSGLHVTAVLGVVGAGLGRLRFLKPGMRVAGSALVMGLYVLLTGAADSALRAGIMSLCALLAPLLLRRYQRHAGLSLAVILLVLINPRAVFQTGVQYTCLAIMGICVLADPVGQWMKKNKPALRTLTQPVLISLSTSLALLPLLLYNSHHYSLYVLFANLIAVPMASALVVLGMGLLLLPAGLAGPVSFAAEHLGRGLVRALGFLDSLPGSFVISAALPAAVLFGFYGLFLLLPVLKNKKAGRLLGFLCAVLILFVAVSSVYTSPARDLEVHVLDVGQGDSILIRHGDRDILVDTGQASAASYTVLPYLRSLGIRELDAIFLTHGDGDHMGGALALTEAYPAAQVYLPRVQDESFLLLESRGATHLLKGDRIKLGQILVDVLNPQANHLLEPGESGNAFSLVLKVSVGSRSVLLMGDCEGLPVSFDLKCDMIVLPHHGSDFRELDTLLYLADPACAAISVGLRNHYDLPDTGTLASLERYAVPLRRTDRDGHIIYRGNEQGFCITAGSKEDIHGIATG